MGSISTTRGDSGSTGLAGGIRVSKASPRVEAYGNIDELISTLGFARSICDDAAITELVHGIQRELFRIGSSLATPPNSPKPPVTIEPALVEELTAEVHRLEAIDGMVSDWTVSGAHAAAAAFDVARTVCRRAERGIVQLAEGGEAVQPTILAYINRLSDLLWLVGRKLELDAGVSGSLRAVTGKTGNRWSRAWMLVFIALTLWSGPAFAQAITVSGRVVDAQGGVVPGADVRVLRRDSEAERRARTDAAGVFRVEGLTPGAFIIQVDKAGFRRHVAPLAVAEGMSSVNVELAVAGVDDTVVVTGAARPQLLGETSKAVSIIDRQEIADRNEAALTDIVRFTPGVQVRDNGGPGQLSQMRIRGVRPDAAAVLVDGLRFRDAATLQGDATSFLSNINFVAADRVEVLRGSGSSLYGSNAVGGVVNIVTAAGGSPFRGDAQVEAGSLGSFRTRGAVNGGALGDRLAYSAGALQWNVTDGLDDDDAARSSGGQGMLRYQLTPVTSLTGRVYASNDRVSLNASPTASGIPSANVPNEAIVDAIAVAPDEIDKFNAGQPFSYGNATFIPGRNDPDSRRTSWFAATALQFQHVQNDRVSWRASYQRVHTNRVFRNGPLGPGFQAAAESFSNPVGDIDTLDARAMLQPTSWIDVAAGYELERERFNDTQDNNLPGAARVATEALIAQHAHTGYASANFALLGRRLQLSLAGRVQRFDLKPVQLSAVGTNNPYSQATFDSPPRAATGDVSLAYAFERSKTRLRTHTGNAYRAPALYERFGGGFSTSPTTGDIIFSAYGDPRLEPDRYRTYDAGVDQSLWRDRLSVSATWFYIDVASLTAFDSSGAVNPTTDPFGRSFGYVNSSGGFSRGVELGVEARPTASLRVAASYTHTRAETDRDITVPGFFLVPAVFEHTATLVVTNRWNSRLDTTFDLFYGGESFGSFFAAGRTRAFRYPSFTRGAVVARLRLSPSADRAIRTYVKVDNLFDDTYYQGGWRAPGRTATVGISADF